MRKEQLFSAIGGAQTAYLQHSERSVFKTAVRTVTAVAACVAITVCLWQMPKPLTSFTAGKPVFGNTGGMFIPPSVGMELVEMEFPAKMSVYENNGYAAEEEVRGFHLSEQQVLQLLQKAMKGLQVTTEDIEYEYIGDSMQNPEEWGDVAEQIYKISAKGDGITIDAKSDGSVHVQFDPPISFENGYGLKTANDWVNRKTSLMLAEKYGDVLGYQNPTLEKDLVYGYVVYDATKDDVVENMARIRFQSTCFYGNEQGTALQGFWIQNKLLGNEKIGEYPTVSYDRAKELWKSGICVVQYADAMEVTFKEQDILWVEMVYGLSNEKVFMPYYWFITEYGSYYIPAIEQRYIADFDLVFQNK